MSAATLPRGAATRARLLEAAAETVAREGCGAASVATIAARAGVATGALYRHFPSKAELLVELFRRAAERQLAEMHEAAAAHDDNLARLEAVLTTYARGALANPRFTWALVYEPVDPVVDAERLAYRRTYREQMARLVAAAVAAGEVPDQDPDIAAAAIVGAMAEALVGPLSPLASRSIPDDDVVAGIVALCRRALG
jgi:AcrR family transcriptional regulator